MLVGSYPIKVGQEVNLRITAISSEGKGIGRISGMAVFVPYTLLKEEVLVRITRIQKNYAEAELVEVLSASPDRVKPLCPAFKSCGACSLVHMGYAAQLHAKQIWVQDALERIGGFKSIDINPIIGMDEPFRYRNKASFPFGNLNGKVVFGCYERKSHKLIPINDCLLQNTITISAMKTLCRWANKFGLKAYESKKGKVLQLYNQCKKQKNAHTTGILRHGMIRLTSDGVMVVVITTGPLPHESELIDYLKSDIPNLRTIIHNINSQDTSLILGKKNRVIYGQKSVEEELMGLKFNVSAESFLQINPVQTLKLYTAAIDGLKLTSADSVIDLYCGIGTISLLMARKAGQVLGIESVPAAIEDAKYNADRNGIKNANFICGNAEDILPRIIGCGKHAHMESEKAEASIMLLSSTDELYSDNRTVNAVNSICYNELQCNSQSSKHRSNDCFTALVLDPPRKGAESEVIDAIIRSGIPRIAYVSCNPATLARDCKRLAGAGYQIDSVQPIDMFPGTVHVETVVLLSKGEIDSKKIRVEFSLEDMDMSGFQTDATYGQIKERVLEQTGLKVSSLDIAQIKQKYGIIERENYNKPKSENSRQPKCPPEKEAAITEALKFFGMI